MKTEQKDRKAPMSLVDFIGDTTYGQSETDGLSTAGRPAGSSFAPAEIPSRPRDRQKMATIGIPREWYDRLVMYQMYVGVTEGRKVSLSDIVVKALSESTVFDGIKDRLKECL